jgi:hypothetical protein
MWTLQPLASGTRVRFDSRMSAVSRTWSSALLAHLGSGQVSRVVYGAIIGLALVVALEAHPPPTGAVIATLLGTAVAVALAEFYSDMLDAKARRRERHRREIAEHALAAAFGISFPVAFFLLDAVGVMEEETAFTVAKWSGLGLIAFYGYCAGRLSGAGQLSSTMQALAVGLIGAALIALKALVH